MSPRGIELNRCLAGIELASYHVGVLDQLALRSTLNVEITVEAYCFVCLFFQLGHIS
jgi:hypothetical protein